MTGSSRQNKPMLIRLKKEASNFAKSEVLFMCFVLLTEHTTNSLPEML
jgi:hypothetical protein